MKLLSKNVSRTASVLGAVGLSAIALMGSAKPADAATLSANLNVKNVGVNTTVFDKYDNQGNEKLTGEFNTQIALNPFTVDVPNVGSASVRTNPNTPSTGKTTISDIGGGNYHIDSFFDIFTQISVDGGQNWIDSEGSNHVGLGPIGSSGTEGFNLISVALPPGCGASPKPECAYIGSTDVHALFKKADLKIILKKPEHSFFRKIKSFRCGINGKDQCEQFISDIKSVPEPITILGSGLALGFGVFFRKKYSSKLKKQTVS